MARCFPYTPQEGFLRNVACARASIGPIKPHVETEKIETGNGKKDIVKLVKGKRSRDKKEETQSKRCKLTKSGGDSRKVKQEEGEISGVTEECDLPVRGRSPCHSSDSVKGTDNPPERKRNAFRIRLNVPKCEEPIIGESTCLPSTSSAQPNHVVEVSPRDPVAVAVEASTEKDVSGSIIDRTLINIPRNANKKRSMYEMPTTIKFSRHENKKMRIYESLTNSLALPALEAEQSEFEDLDWLSTSSKPERCSSSTAGSNSSLSCGASLCTTWPKALCLPEVDVYALPYTVPF